MLEPPKYPSRTVDVPSGVLVTDEFHETISGLFRIHKLLCEVERAPAMWKLILIEAHSTLQNACVCLLTDTGGLGALDKKSTEKILEHRNRGGSKGQDWPRERLADFPTLLKRFFQISGVEFSTKPDWGAYDSATDLMRLHDLRNNFSHYKPSTWLFKESEFPRILLHCISTTKTVIESENFQRYNHFREYEFDQYFEAIFKKIAKLQDK